MQRIGAVSPLRRFAPALPEGEPRWSAVDLLRGCGWNRCGEPSQALRASSPGGRAKGLVGIDRRSDTFRFVMLFEVCTKALPLPPGEVPPEGRGRGMCRQWGGGRQFVRGISAVILRVVCG